MTKLPPLTGSIDVRVWEEDNPQRHGLGLHQDGALPLKAKDRIRIEAKLSRPAFAYVLWISPAGKVIPVYPWSPGKWEECPAEEQPVTELRLPSGSHGWPIKSTSAGMETLVLLARDDALPRSVDLHALLVDLPEQKMQNPRAAVWFKNGEVISGDVEREPNFFEVQPVDDPVLRTQRLLQEKLQRHFAYSWAVSFANQGKE
jgi:hypothetical protein